MSDDKFTRKDWRVRVYLKDPLEELLLPPYYGVNQPEGDDYGDALVMSRDAGDRGFSIERPNGGWDVYPSHRVIRCWVHLPGKDV